MYYKWGLSLDEIKHVELIYKPDRTVMLELFCKIQVITFGVWVSIPRFTTCISIGFDMCTHVINHWEQNMTLTFMFEGQNHSGNIGI